MPSRPNSWTVFGCTLGLSWMLLLGSAGSALASATVRFVHAVPGAGPATLSVSADGQGVSSAPVSFGSASARLEVQEGSASLTVAPADGGDALAKGEEELEDGGSYTVVALAGREGEDAQVRVYEDEDPEKGQARLRAIHAAPELGSPEFRAGDQVVAEKLEYGNATEYETVPPATYNLSATRSGGSGGALAEKRGVPLTAGTATTAVIIGTSGETTRIVTLSDGTAAPSGAPATGFGGLAGDDGEPSRLLVALLFGVVAAAFGAASWSVASRR
jgi:Domain of unknown function (DUF4397)